MKAKKSTAETIADIGTEKRDFPSFNVGDRIAVVIKVVEGTKERNQTFEGDVIAMKKHGISSTFTVRKMGAHGIAVERIFPYYSPIISSIKRIAEGKVRRAKLYYLRERIGKAARIKEKKKSAPNKKKTTAPTDKPPTKDGGAPTTEPPSKHIAPTDT